MKIIDRLIDGITMYRLLLYYLLILLATAMGLGAFNILHYSPQAIFASTAYLLLACWLINKLFGYVWKVPVNPESSLLTALILALIISPVLSVDNFILLTMASLLAMASKYLLAINKQHIFNPAAIAMVLLVLAANQSASWWVGTTWLMPVVIIGGLLIARKIRRFTMVLLFLAVATLATLALTYINHGDLVRSLNNIALHSSLFFLAFVMLTEPLTSPARYQDQLIYAVLVGVLFPPQLHLLSLYSSPELILVIGNVYAYAVNPKAKLLPHLIQKLSWGPATKDFVFNRPEGFDYLPGQYMEWTLPHSKPDERGSRRYFTLASSPTEDNIRLGVKFYAEGSSFKRAMRSMEAGDMMAAGQLSGDFVLPSEKQKLVFIAGGIGITPFRSMLKYMIDTQEVMPLTVLYSETRTSDVAYHDVLRDARERLGAKVVYTFTDEQPDKFRHGRIDAAMIAEEVPDYQERLFYISGPHPMVTSIKSALKQMGVKERNIKIDFFPGYA